MSRTAGIWPYVCLAPALAIFVLLEIIPAFATSVFSLTDYTGLPGTVIHWVGIDNYVGLLAGQQTFLLRALVLPHQRLMRAAQRWQIHVMQRH